MKPHDNQTSINRRQFVSGTALTAGALVVTGSLTPIATTNSASAGADNVKKKTAKNRPAKEKAAKNRSAYKKSNQFTNKEQAQITRVVGSPLSQLTDADAIDKRLATSSQNVVDPAQSRDHAIAADIKTNPLLQNLMDCLGGPWPAPPALNEQIRATTDHDDYSIVSLTFDAEPNDPVPALLLIPAGVSADHPAPAVAIWHQHAGQYHLGKSEPAGLAGNPMHHTGVALVNQGYVVLCIDALCFEERQHPRMQNRHFEEHAFLRYVVAGKSLAWKNILDMRRAIDYLCTRPEVDAANIGCYGHSMGSTHTWLVSPWETRLKCAVGNCCLPTYKAIQEHDLLHCFPNFVPGWAQYGDTPEIAGLTAPRALHLNFGTEDGGSPIAEVRNGIKRIEQMYARANAADQFTAYIQDDVGHVLSDEMWQRTRDTFARRLKGES